MQEMPWSSLLSFFFLQEFDCRSGRADIERRRLAAFRLDLLAWQRRTASQTHGSAAIKHASVQFWTPAWLPPRLGGRRPRCLLQDIRCTTKLVQRCVRERSWTPMPPSLDIFKIDPGGRVLWRGAVESFVAAKARIQKLALSSLSSPGEYLILDQDTGQRVLVMLLGISPQTRLVTKLDARPEP